MPDANPNQPEPSGVAVAPGVRVPAAVLRFSFVRASGPGGQNVNKRSTAAELRVSLADLPIAPGARLRLADAASHLVTADGELIIECDEHRSQERNRGGCLERLRELVVRALAVPKVRRKTRPSRGSKERRLSEKKHRGATKAHRRDGGDQD